MHHIFSYMEKINVSSIVSRNDNCKFELNYAFDHKSIEIQVVTMDDTMSNPNNWKLLLKGMLGGYLFVSMNKDFDDVQYLDTKITELVKQLAMKGITPSQQGNYVFSTAPFKGFLRLFVHLYLVKFMICCLLREGKVL